jgi:hypothetical protein
MFETNRSDRLIFNSFTSVNQLPARPVNQPFTVMGHHHFTARSPFFGTDGGVERRCRGELIAVMSKGLLV